MIDLDQIHFFVKEAALPSYTKRLQMGEPGRSLAQLASGNPQPGRMAALMAEKLKARRAQQSRAHQAGADLRQAVGGAAARLRRLVRR